MQVEDLARGGQQRRDPRVSERVADRRPLFVRHDDVLAAQHRELLGDERLVERERLLELLDAALARGEHLEDTYPNRVREGAEELRLEHLQVRIHNNILEYYISAGQVVVGRQVRPDERRLPDLRRQDDLAFRGRGDRHVSRTPSASPPRQRSRRNTRIAFTVREPSFRERLSLRRTHTRIPRQSPPCGFVTAEAIIDVMPGRSGGLCQ